MATTTSTSTSALAVAAATAGKASSQTAIQAVQCRMAPGCSLDQRLVQPSYPGPQRWKGRTRRARRASCTRPAHTRADAPRRVCRWSSKDSTTV